MKAVLEHMNVHFVQFFLVLKRLLTKVNEVIAACL